MTLEQTALVCALVLASAVANQSCSSTSVNDASSGGTSGTTSDGAVGGATGGSMTGGEAGTLPAADAAIDVDGGVDSDAGPEDAGPFFGEAGVCLGPTDQALCKQLSGGIDGGSGCVVQHDLLTYLCVNSSNGMTVFRNDNNGRVLWCKGEPADASGACLNPQVGSKIIISSVGNLHCNCTGETAFGIDGCTYSCIVP